LGLAAAILAVAAPASAQPQRSPFNSATARVKAANESGIIQGQKTPKGAFPFMVALIHSDAADDEEGNYGGQYCGGVLVSPRWVLTSGLCVSAENEDKQRVAVEPDKVDVYAGSNNFKGGKRIKVKRVITHPKFDPETYDNDIALIELEENATVGTTGTIALATAQNEAAVGGVGKKVTAAGWGETETKDLPQDLRHVEMDVLDATMCNTNIINYRKSTVLGAWAKLTQTQFALSDNVAKQVRGLVENNAGKVVNDNMICSGRPKTKRDTCAGDNGGPLFAKGADGKFVLVGITSWGEGCGLSDKGLYGIYTRASRYTAWVQENAK
jgi:secreted trypsin-like serine protease